MHSIYSRANAIFAFMLWVLTAVTAGCFLTTVFLDYNGKVELDVNDIKIRRVNDYSSDTGYSDVAHFNFNIKTDVTPLFNWNVKQLFFYLVAEYSSPKNGVNQVVVWDRIVHRADRVVIDERSIKPEYFLVDDGNHFRSIDNVTFVLRYNVVPNAGYLRLAQSGGQIQVEMPTEYMKGKAI